ncbi:MAG: GAF domain-containing protein [Anaerolineae bacterium]|nr:GAF domain-containing protein [Anaerolineae bacterium]
MTKNNSRPLAQQRRRTSIRRRLLAQSVVTLGLLLLAAVLISWQVSRLLNATTVLETAAERVRVVGDVRTSSTALLGTVSRLVPLQDGAVFSRDVGAVLADLEASQTELTALAEAEQDEAVSRALEEVAARVSAIISLSRTMVLQAQDGQWPSVQVRVGVLNRDQQQINAELNRLVEQVQERQQEASREVAAARQAAILFSGIVGFLTILVTVIAFVDINRRIGGPVAALTSGAERLASGAFGERVQIDSNDEMGDLAQAFNAMAMELQASYGELEERVQQRTRDLALAAEVGQRLSLVRNLDELLNEAVTRVRDRFDLYYTQVYLVDETGRNLALQAGTGSVGEELVRRSFRLPVDRTSINGTAAIEKEAVIISDTAQSAIFRPNVLLPDTRSEMAVPLLVGDEVLGVLDLQSNEAGALTEEILPAFEALAGQLAIAVENARLFRQGEEARRVAAGAAQHRIQDGWQDYLNAIDRQEFIGFAYSGAGIGPLDEPLTVAAGGDEETVLTAPITLHEAEIGAIELLAPTDRPWAPEQLELVKGVADQIAQQVENLRLLAESQRYRDEAEAALRRATQAGWARFQETAGEVLAYSYERGQVAPKPASRPVLPGRVSVPLFVRGEPVGEMLIPEDAGEHKASRLVDAIAGRLSAHIENLRLSQQTELALAEAERRSAQQTLLNRVVSEISATLDLRESLNIVAKALAEATSSDQARIALRRPGRSTLTVVAEVHDPQRTPSALGLEISIDGNPLTQKVIAGRRSVLVTGVQASPEAEPIRDMLRTQGIETLLLLPIVAGTDVIGTVGIDLLEPGATFTAEERLLAESIVLQAGTAIQNARLFEQVQETLAVTERLYNASARLNAASDLQETVAAVAEGGQHPAFDRVVLFLLEQNAEGALEAIVSAATWHSGKGPAPTPVGSRYDQDTLEALHLVVTGEPLFVDEIETDERADPATKAVFRALDIRSLVVIPVTARGRQLGSLLLEGGEVQHFVPEEFETYIALAGQLALALDRQMLLTSAQRRAERERLINVISQKIQTAPTIDNAMQVALAELGQALRARRGYVALRAAPGANGDEEAVVTE